MRARDRTCSECTRVRCEGECCEGECWGGFYCFCAVAAPPRRGRSCLRDTCLPPVGAGGGGGGAGGALGRVSGRPGYRTGQGQTERRLAARRLVPATAQSLLLVLPAGRTHRSLHASTYRRVATQGLVLIRERTQARVPGADSRLREPTVCSSDLVGSRPLVCTLASHPAAGRLSAPTPATPMPAPHAPLLPCLTCAAGGSGSATTSSTGRADRRPHLLTVQMKIDMSCGRWCSARDRAAGRRRPSSRAQATEQQGAGNRAAGSEGEQRRGDRGKRRVTRA